MSETGAGAQAKTWAAPGPRDDEMKSETRWLKFSKQESQVETSGFLKKSIMGIWTWHHGQIMVVQYFQRVNENIYAGDLIHRKCKPCSFLSTLNVVKIYVGMTYKAKVCTLMWKRCLCILVILVQGHIYCGRHELGLQNKTLYRNS